MEADPDETECSVERDGRVSYLCSKSCKENFDPEKTSTTVRERAMSLPGWKALADEQRKEWGMLQDEIAIGFAFAGLIAGLIPDAAQTSALSGPMFGLSVYIFWTAALGAVIGVATFVYSAGNAPFGVALFSNGLPFGSVLSYIYTDLVVPPIVDAYREYYETTFAAVLSGVIFVAAVLTSVVIHLILLGARLIPVPESAQVAEVNIEADYKLVLNAFVTGLFGVLY